MKSKLMPETVIMDDGRLVARVLEGDREAFGQLVARYQSAVCSLAYSACGSVARSEDLAQETFLIAWKKLADLSEPGKFRPWLFGIARNLINNSFRQQSRNPLAAADSLEEDAPIESPVGSPVEQAMSQEEEAILWKSLGRIPENYREPLILFYREHQSVEQVATILELTEETVRQRLSRGRKLLQEQVMAFVEGALKHSAPGPAFTLAVLAALPAMTFSAKAATVGAGVKGGAAIKGAGAAGAAISFLAPLILFAGMWMDYRFKRQAGHSPADLKNLKKYYLGMCLGVIGFVIVISLLLAQADTLIKTRPGLFLVFIAATILGYPLMLVWLARQFFRRTKKENSALPDGENAVSSFRPTWEYRSQWQLLGLPLIHIRFGGWLGRSCNVFHCKPKPVIAWFAATDGFAIGIIGAYGGMAFAPFSIGACAIGLISYGAVAAGGIAIGGFSLGLLSCGALAFGWNAYGDCVIAWHIANGARFGIAHDYALGGIARAAEVNTDFVRNLVRADTFFSFCWNFLKPVGVSLFWLWGIPLFILSIREWWLALRGKSLKNPSTKKL